MSSSALAMLKSYREVPCTWGRNHDREEVDHAITAMTDLIDKVDSALTLGWNDTAARELRAALARVTGELP